MRGRGAGSDQKASDERTTMDAPRSEVDVLRGRLAEVQRELDRATARFRDVIERNADAQIVVTPDGMIRFANHAAERLFSRPAHQLVGSHFGFPVVGGETTEVELISRGAAVSAEMRVVRTEWEGERAYLASLRDITQRKHAEMEARRLVRVEADYAAAQAAARHQAFLLESTTLLTSSLDYRQTLATLARLCTRHVADWAVVYGIDEQGLPCRVAVEHRDPAKAAVAEELCRIPIEASTAHPVLEIVKSGRPSFVREITDEQLGAMKVSPREIEIARIMGVRSWLSVPMTARGRPVGAIALVRATHSFTEGEIAIAQDIAHRAALAVDNAVLYQEAARANQTKSDFLAVVSHDLRTPMTAIIGYSDLMLAGIPDQLPEGSREYVQRVQRAAHHLLFLLNELLEFSRLEASAVTVKSAETNVGEVVRDVAAVMEGMAGQRGIALAIDLPEQPIIVETDPDKLRQIVMNLTGNAVKYTDKGGVSLRAEHVATGMQLRVRDTGRGIAKEHLGRIYDPFWQVEGGERKRADGAGLGLSVVRKLIDLLGGEIDVDSEVGVGTTFTVRLPARAHSPAA